MINFDKAFQSVRKEYRETGHMSFLNGANAVLSELGVVGGVAQSVSSIQNFNKMRSSLSSKPSLSNGSGQQYANIADGVCFVAGTEIKTEEGRKAIEEIEAGDRVYARNTETGEEGYKEVVRVFRKETKELIHLWIGNTKIDATPNHPFWIEGYGFREAGELQEGDRVLTADGEVLAVARVELEVLEEPVRVYNFEVADWHTYYVSEEEVLVHNTCTAGDGATTGIENLLKNRPELTGTTREKLLATVQDSELSKIINELYRPGATVGDGGTASILVQEFNNGSSKHLIKATERLKQLKNLSTSGKLGLNDLDVVGELINDLENAIGLFN